VTRASEQAAPRTAPAASTTTQLLDPGIRVAMEARFGHDFGSVRIHADDAAARSASAVDALAYTRGNDIVFGRGAYRPETAAGRHLIAHELAHVVQQRRGETTGLQRMEAGEDALVEPAGSGLSSLSCNPLNHEGFPLLLRGAKRSAVGFAQTKLNAHLERIIACLQSPPCPIPDLNRVFIENELMKLTELPLEIDCKFGPNTASATKIVQAFFLRNSAEWDGKIGPVTWELLDLVPPFSRPALPPVPPPPGPIFL
jgi:hypothetical protein